MHQTNNISILGSLMTSDGSEALELLIDAEYLKALKWGRQDAEQYICVVQTDPELIEASRLSMISKLLSTLANVPGANGYSNGFFTRISEELAKKQ